MDELEIAPADVKARLDRGEKLVLIDVREPWEHQFGRIEGAKLVPLGSLAASLPDPSRRGRGDLLLPSWHAQSGRGSLAAVSRHRKSEISSRRNRTLVA